MSFILLCTIIGLALADFQQAEIWEGPTFYDHFDFFTGGDPTHGYVSFANKQQAFDWGLAKPGFPTYMGADFTQKATGSGRAAIRLTSKTNWNVRPGTPEMLFVMDLSHMPTGCGTWPAWWFFGPNWPNGGEIDVIEGVNQQTTVATTLHTNAGCRINNGGFTGRVQTSNCDVNAPGQPANAGCTIMGAANSYGAPFNSRGGGVFATLWGHDSIRSWFFPRGSIPGDLAHGSSRANPDGWGTPYARFNLDGSCPLDHFTNLNMIFDLTFCGDWAGAVFGNDCPGKGSCVDFVQNNPSAFKEAYWSINFIKIMKTASGSPPPAPKSNPPPPPSNPGSGYEGCAIDSATRALPSGLWVDPAMTPSKCQSHCKGLGFKFAGIEFGTECYCGNSAFPQGKSGDGDCNMNCGGDAGKKCGGNWRLSVYSTGTTSSPPPAPKAGSISCPARCRINGDASKVCQPPGCPPCRKQSGSDIDCLNYNVPATRTCPSGSIDCSGSGGRLEGDSSSDSDYGFTQSQKVGLAVGLSLGGLLIVAVLVGLFIYAKKSSSRAETV